GAGNERLDPDRLVAFRHRLGDFIRLENHELSVAGLVALDLLVPLDGFLGLLVKILAVYPMARLAIDDVEGNALRRRRAGVERDREGQLGKLDMTLPGRTRCHERHSTPVPGWLNAQPV